MRDILEKIVERKKIETINLEINKDEVIINSKNIYEIIQQNKPFYISEFKRKSPSEGNIGLEINLDDQINKYINAGTKAISVLTDEFFFGGNQDDLIKTVQLVKDKNILVLQKDFIICEQQVYLARKNGADLILLIARILEPQKLIKLKKIAENLGMGVLLELHNLKEFEPLKSEQFNLIGINNRDLDTFEIYLNRFNVLVDKLPKNSYLISESGIQSALDISISKQKAHGFLVGTSLMKKLKDQTLNEFYQYKKQYFFKSCGLRDFSKFNLIKSDLVGINFSPISKRKITKEKLQEFIYSDKLVAVFKNNNFEEIQNIQEKYKFNYIQFYPNDLNLNQIKQIKCKKIFAFNPNQETEYQEALKLAEYIDFFILDSTEPGSGKTFSLDNAKDFPYPFLLAGGININNFTKIYDLKNCFGIDSASGIETNSSFDINKVNDIYDILNKKNALSESR